MLLRPSPLLRPGPLLRLLSTSPPPPSQEASLSLDLPSLRNTFLGLRHGNSEANQLGVVSSSPAVATVSHGLSPLGVSQATASALAFAGQVKLERYSENVRIVTSDFLRARATADVLFSKYSNSDVDILTCNLVDDERLRERFFGELDGGPDDR